MKKISFSLILTVIMAVGIFLPASAKKSRHSQASFTVASYNLRNANRSDSVNGNGWGQRMPYICDIVRFHGFDIFGTQECFRHQLDSLVSRLPGYAYIGIGRDDGKRAGEHSAIFYDKNQFDVLDSGNFWLSETPDRPGLGWDAVCTRICTWGKFRHRASGREFIFANLHMDHVGRKARVEGAKLVRRKLAEIAPDCPAIVTGDFNVDQNDPVYGTMTSDGDFRDSYEIAGFRYAPTGTFNNFRPDGFTTSRIDHVFLTPQFVVEKYGILTDTYRAPDPKSPSAGMKTHDAPSELEMERYIARTPSDHFPVAVHLTLK